MQVAQVTPQGNIIPSAGMQGVQGMQIPRLITPLPTAQQIRLPIKVFTYRNTYHLIIITSIGVGKLFLMKYRKVFCEKNINRRLLLLFIVFIIFYLFTYIYFFVLFLPPTTYVYK